MESFITWKSLDIQSITKSIKLGLLDLTNKNVGCLGVFEFQIKTKYIFHINTLGILASPVAQR